jgi:DNA-binding LacI/PurR family transcriptional regulator
MVSAQESASKTEQANSALVALLHARGPGIKLPTIEEMCAQVGVSRTTLEAALQMVERRGLVRRRRGSGIYVTERIRQKTIGVVFGRDIFSPGFSPYWSLLLQAIGAQAGACGLRPQAYLDIPQGQGGLGGHAQLFEDLDAQRLDGLMLFAPHYAYDEVGPLRAYGIPLILPCGAPPDWVVTKDHDAGIRLAAREIARQSRRHIGLLAAPDYRPLLEAELRQHGLTNVTIDDWSYETWACSIPRAGSREHCAYRLTQHVISQTAQHSLPEVVLSLDDTATRGVLTALLQAGLQPGRDLTLLSSANAGSPVLAPYAEGLICLTFDPADEVRVALTMLETLMNGGTPAENPVLIAPTVTPAPRA